MPEWGEMDEGILELDTCYYVSKPAEVLLKYLYDARRVWDYDN